METLETLMTEDLSLSMKLDGIRLIEASAGTGKTFTIAGLYARLVIEKKVALRKILVMTFTRAACEELRTRLRERLQLCAALVDDPACAPDGPEPDTDNAEQRIVLALLRRVREKGDESHAALRRRILGAVHRMDEAVVVTIHGFCQRVLDEFAAQLDGGGPDAELETSDLDLLEDIAADLWLQVAGEDDPARLAALQQLAASPAALAKILQGLVYFPGALEPAGTDADLDSPVPDVEAAKKELLAHFAHGAAEACATFEQWFQDGRLHSGWYRDGCELQLRQVCAELAAKRVPSDEALGKFRLEKLRRAVGKDAKAQHGDFPDRPEFAAIDTWLAMREREQAHLAAMSVALLHELVDKARNLLERRKRALARMSYEDQIERLHAGLTGTGHEALLQALRQQFPYAMVDEFQDTSPRQFQIFRCLYEGYGSLLIIGDPKQAIYGFRGGDVHAYLRAGKLRTGDKQTLKSNYRSSPEFLSAIDAVFGERGANVFVEPGIEFEKVEAGAEPKGNLCINEEPATPLTLWQMPGEKQSADENRAAMARAAAVQIADLLDPTHARIGDKPVEPGQVAVLVTKNKEAALVLSELRKLHIPAVSVQKRSVFATPEAGEVLRLLDALLAPESLALARGALATLLLGQTLADFAAMQDDETRLHAQLERLAELRRIWLRRGVLAMLERVIEQRAAQLLALADGERRVANLMQLAEALQQAAHELSGPGALRDWLARHVRDADDGREDEQLRLESDAECVQVMTLHRSKGLEFDLVLLPFMAMREVQPAKKGELVRFHRGDAAVRRLITSAGGKARGDEDAAAAKLAHREQLAEDVRLLYVGLTRARHACWMSVLSAGTEPDKANGDDEYPKSLLKWVLRKAPDGSALAHASEHIVVRALPRDPTGQRQMPAAAQPAAARRFTRKLQHDWWVHSFSQLNRGQRELELDLPADRDDSALPVIAESGPVEVMAWPRGADYGNAVHAMLEHADFAAWCDAETPPAKQLELVLRHLRQAGFSGSELAQAADATGRLLLDSLHAPFIDATRLVDLSPAARRAEMRFHFGMAGTEPAELLSLLHRHGYQRQRQGFASLHGQLRGLMHGIIDLVCRHDERWWVIDYKTNHLGDRWADYDANGMQTAIEQHGYDLQYLIYTVAAHRWLGQVLGNAYDYQRDFGGVRYLFLRGMHGARPGSGIFADKPPAELIEALDALLAAPGCGVAA